MNASTPALFASRIIGVVVALVLLYSLAAVLPGEGTQRTRVVFAQSPAVPAESTNEPGHAPALPDAFPLLVDQYNLQGLSGIVSVNSIDLPGYYSLAADDFVIGSGYTWSIVKVEVDGTYGGSPGPAMAVNVYFYADNGGLPGAVVASRLLTPFASGPAAGDFVITLSPPVVLHSGHYWMSVQANMPTGTGSWQWADRTQASEYSAAWENPGAGLGSPECVNWGTRSTTCKTDMTEPDQVFRLAGTVGSTAIDQACNAQGLLIPSDGPASPYPSNITVSGVGDVLDDVNVVLNGLSHTYPGDLALLLVGPTGQNAVIMGGVGGDGDVFNITLVLDDEAPTALRSSATLTEGSYQPTKAGGGYLYLFPSPAPTASESVNLATFDGTNPNGTWNLYVWDRDFGDAGSVSGGWCLQLQAHRQVHLPLVKR